MAKAHPLHKQVKCRCLKRPGRTGRNFPTCIDRTIKKNPGRADRSTAQETPLRSPFPWLTAVFLPLAWHSEQAKVYIICRNGWKKVCRGWDLTSAFLEIGRRAAVCKICQNRDRREIKVWNYKARRHSKTCLLQTSCCKPLSGLSYAVRLRKRSIYQCRVFCLQELGLEMAAGCGNTWVSGVGLR